jgi:HK97 gp10 family phage protein
MGLTRQQIIDGLRPALNAVEAAAKRRAPKRKGTLARSIRSRLVEGGPVGIYGVVEATADYASYVHDGTGLHGPAKRMIVMPPGKIMVFQGDDGRTVFTRKSRGQRPQPFLTQALDEVLG